MKTIEVKCPTCHTVGYFDITDQTIEDVKKSTRGLLSINVPEELICEHSFIAYVDKNLHVRDCLKADFLLDLTVETTEAEEKKSKTPISELDNLDVITKEFSEEFLSSFIRAVLLKRKIVIISEENHNYQHLLNLIDYFTQTLIEKDITIHSIVEYMYEKEKYQDCIVFGKNKVLKDMDGIFDLRKIKFERTIIEKFLTESEVQSSLIILKNEILRVWEHANILLAYMKKSKKKEFTVKSLINFFLKKPHNLKIKNRYLDLLVDIVKYYYSLEITVKSGTSTFLEML